MRVAVLAALLASTVCTTETIPIPIPAGRAEEEAEAAGKASTASPSSETATIAQGFGQPLHVAVFGPPDAATVVAAAAYFRELESLGAPLEVHVVDPAHATREITARFGPPNDQSIVIATGDRREAFPASTMLARSGDGHVRKAMAKLARKTPTVALVGDAAGEGKDGLERAAASVDFDVVPTPEAADIVVVVARAPLDDATVAMVKERWKRGGGTLLALEPDAARASAELLRDAGLAVAPHPLVTGESPRVTASKVTPHRAVARLAKLRTAAAVVFDAPTTLHAVPHAKPGIVFVVTAPEDAWLDTNGNATRDAGEAGPEAHPESGLVAATDLGAARVIVIADVDVLLDASVRGNASNRILYGDALTWLARQL